MFPWLRAASESCMRWTPGRLQWSPSDCYNVRTSRRTGDLVDGPEGFAEAEIFRFCRTDEMSRPIVLAASLRSGSKGGGGRGHAPS